MKDWLHEILRNPQTGERVAAIPDDIPSFLDEVAPTVSQFNYVEHYTTDAEQFDYFRELTDHLTATHLRLLRASVMRSVPDDASLLLDVGCGSAFVAGYFCPKGRRVVSMDIARANTCKALAKYPYDNHAAVVADAYHLPFAKDIFDCIIAAEIIEHTVDPQGFVASLLTKLKPGGTLIVSTPYKEQIAYSLCIHCNCKTPHNAHLHSFDKEKVRQMLATLPADITSMHLVGNKLLLHSHLSVLLSHLGYPLWRGVDGLSNLLLPKAEHFVITVKKRNDY